MLTPTDFFDLSDPTVAAIFAGCTPPGNRSTTSKRTSPAWPATG